MLPFSTKNPPLPPPSLSLSFVHDCQISRLFLSEPRGTKRRATHHCVTTSLRFAESSRSHRSDSWEISYVHSSSSRSTVRICLLQLPATSLRRRFPEFQKELDDILYINAKIKKSSFKRVMGIFVQPLISVQNSFRLGLM